MAAFQDLSEDNFRNGLLCFKHKMRNMVWTKGTSGLQGDFQSDSEVSITFWHFDIHISWIRLQVSLAVAKSHNFNLKIKGWYLDCENILEIN